MLANLLSSKTRAEFLRILFGINRKELHLREIQRQTELAISTVKQEASKLEELGLVIQRKNGNRTYFSANKEHPLYNEIHNIVLKTIGLSDFLKQSLTTDKIKFAFVFGSIASGLEKPESDVDLFVLGDIGLRELSKLLKEPTEKIGREINPHIMTIDEFMKRKRQNEHFVTSVLKSPKIMIKGSDDELEKLGE
jgi:DNA-binding transcriptional ArsR family regulator